MTVNYQGDFCGTAKNHIQEAVMAMQEVSFLSEGDRLAAMLFLPEQTPAPAVILAHGVFEFKEAGGTASASMQYVADIFTRVVVRNTGDAAIKIKGYTAAVTIDTGGGTASATRIENTVYGT